MLIYVQRALLSILFYLDWILIWLSIMELHMLMHLLEDFEELFDCLKFLQFAREKNFYGKLEYHLGINSSMLWRYFNNFCLQILF